MEAVGRRPHEAPRLAPHGPAPPSPAPARQRQQGQRWPCLLRRGGQIGPPPFIMARVGRGWAAGPRTWALADYEEDGDETYDHKRPAGGRNSRAGRRGPRPPGPTPPCPVVHSSPLLKRKEPDRHGGSTRDWAIWTQISVLGGLRQGPRPARPCPRSLARSQPGPSQGRGGPRKASQPR